MLPLAGMATMSTGTMGMGMGTTTAMPTNRQAGTSAPIMNPAPMG